MSVLYLSCHVYFLSRDSFGIEIYIYSILTVLTYLPRETGNTVNIYSIRMLTCINMAAEAANQGEAGGLCQHVATCTG